MKPKNMIIEMDGQLYLMLPISDQPPPGTEEVGTLEVKL